MITDKIVPRSRRWRVVQTFGDAQLVKLPNGQYELIGGSEADITAVKEWVSLFAHTIAFTHFQRAAVKPCRRPKASLVACLRMLI